ncbi:hypothetical protein [Methanobacterium sp.]|uniref:hypothetical protein n=1 Tax=Methanobacterium sp. TaxID=2164 RepID=UPI002ABCE16E|nr:hypothetical protein [Methanobacterium sp.]MDY9923324.1 hypothetical protein [Methanobacterium sp.]
MKEMMLIKLMKKDGIILILMIAVSLTLCGVVTAHPGHGIPIEETNDPGTGDGTDTGTTDVGSSDTSGSSQSSSSSGSTSSGSTSTSSGSKSSTTGGTGSDQTATDTPTTDNSNATTTSASGPEEVTGNTVSTNSPGGPVAMIGLMIVVGLIAMSFPYKEGSTLSKLQMSLFGR